MNPLALIVALAKYLRDRAVGLWRINFGKHLFGVNNAHEALTGLLSLVVVTAASYAITVNTIAERGVYANWFYAVITSVIVLIAWQIGTSKSNSGEYLNDKATLRFSQLTIAVAIFLCVAGVWMQLYEYFPGQTPSRQSYAEDRIQIVDPDVASLRAANVHVHGGQREGTARDSALIERFITWFGQGANTDPAAEQVVIIEQHPAFQADYETFSAVMMFRESGFEFLDAQAFLRRRPSSSGCGPEYVPVGWKNGDLKDVVSEYVYEHLPLPRGQSGQAYPVFTIPKPDKGDAVIVFAKFRRRPNSTLPLDVNSLGISLWRAY